MRNEARPFRYPKTSNQPLVIEPPPPKVDWTAYGSFESVAPSNLRNYLSQATNITGPVALQPMIGPAWEGQNEYLSVLDCAATLGHRIQAVGRAGTRSVRVAAAAQAEELSEMVQWTWGPPGGIPLLSDFTKPRADWTHDWGPDVFARAVEMYLDFCAESDPDPGGAVAVKTPLAYMAAVDAAEEVVGDAVIDGEQEGTFSGPSAGDFLSPERERAEAKEARRLAAHDREFVNPSDTNPGWPTFKSGPNRRLRRLHAIHAGAVLAGRMTVSEMYARFETTTNVRRAAVKFTRLQNKPATAVEYFETPGSLHGMQGTSQVTGFYCRQRGIYVGDLPTALLAGPGVAELKWAMRENPAHSADPTVIAQVLAGPGVLVDGDFKKFDLYVRAEHTNAFRVGTSNWLARRLGVRYARIWNEIVERASHLDILEPRVRSADAAFRHFRKHGLNSGVKWTSIQGGLTNAVCQLLTYAWLAYGHLDAVDAIRRALDDLRMGIWAMAVWGDDAMLRIPASMKERWAETIAAFALRMEMSDRTSFLKVDYEKRGDVVHAYGGVASHFINKFNKEVRLIARAPGALVLSMAASAEMLRDSPFFPSWRDAIMNSTHLAAEALAAAERLTKGGVERVISDMLRDYGSMSVNAKKATRAALNNVLMLRSSADARIQILAGQAINDGYTDMRTWVEEGRTVSTAALNQMTAEIASYMAA